jgi:hypothetical protein
MLVGATEGVSLVVGSRGTDPTFGESVEYQQQHADLLTVALCWFARVNLDFENKLEDLWLPIDC